MAAAGLIRSQRALHGRISRTVDNLKKLGQANITTGAVEARLAGLEKYWSTFESQHETLLREHWDALSEDDYVTGDLISVVEETYYVNKGILNDFAAQAARSGEASTSSTTTVTVSEGTSHRTTLPRIQLPQFSGKYSEWNSFRDLFLSIMRQDASTSSVEKLHYLKTCLKGEAALLIRNVPTTAENFERAWNTLVRRFENKRLLVRSFLSEFLALHRIKGESASELSNLYNRVRSTVDSLESIGRPVTSSEDFFVHSIVELLDPHSRREWENSINDSTDPPSYIELQRFIERRLQTLEALQPSKSETGGTKTGSTAARQSRTLHTRQQEVKRGRCSMCRQDHFTMACDTYKSKTAVERKKLVEAKDLCVNCLGRHKVSECASTKRCASCNEQHHSTLHDAFRESEAALTTVQHARHPPERPLTRLLATARVRVADRFGYLHVFRALIDQGSESCLVTEALVQRLQLPRTRASVAIYGIGGVQTGSARGLVTLQVSPLGKGPTLSVPALVFPQLSIYEGTVEASTKTWNHLRGLELADPEFLATDPVDLLLGVDFIALTLLEGVRRGGPQEPVAQQTTFGWMLFGPTGQAEPACRVAANTCRVEEDLTALVRNFWKQEELLSTTPPLSQEDRQCEEMFRLTHTRTEEGRYVVRLPTKEPLPDFTATRISALRVLKSMERRFAREERFHHLYRDFLTQYRELGHMSRVVQEEGTNRVINYLPHHGVMREASTTTKLRVVFNGSTPTPAGRTLNQCLMTGPNLLPPLPEIILRWRQHRYVLATDVEKMFRQIVVHPDDRDLQRILWRDVATDDIAEYRLDTVTYGLACAPYLAMRTLHQLADDERERYPRGAAVLERDVYMDDVLTGAATLEEALELRRQLTDLCTAGGFPLRKWSANDFSLLDGVPADHRMKRELRDWHTQEAHSALGLQWHPRTDDFSFSTQQISIAGFTKRSVLSLTARLFDPLGWLAPTVVSAKIAFQSTWLLQLGWDDTLDEDSAKFWQRFRDELPLEVELHGFADASERAYASVVYLRSPEEGSWRVTLLAAKTKVAPIKPVTLPRLELCAAALLARLISQQRRALGLERAPLHCWSDSTVTLGWIQGHPSRWKTYVANRVAEIQTTAPDALWHHIPGQENPADCASRGLLPGDLVKHELWWRGPAWLWLGTSAWPLKTGCLDTTELPDARTRAHAAVTTTLTDEEPAELLRFSSLNRLLRVTAWCRRWLRFRGGRSSVDRTVEPCLTMDELDESRLQWIRRVQTQTFRKDLEALRQSQSPRPSTSLIKLNPITDSRGLLRVGGRLKHSLLDPEERHPIILPADSHFTLLIVEDCHRRSLHGGVQLTLSLLRQRYWVLRGRALTKRVIHRCVRCVRWRAAPAPQQMGDLPQERVRPFRPFLNTGIDYAGPVQLRTTKGRGHRSYKAYVAVFVCLSTRAVHLEVVSDYTTEAFLAALRRFVSRRGLCRTLWSDRGTTFVGADARLRELFSEYGSERRRLNDVLTAEGIRWRFNPPSAPHFGGIWEAAVKSFKHHLRRVLGNATLTFEEMTTLLAQIEACLNSRPLQSLSDDPEDLTALTPGHFLVGDVPIVVPEPSLTDVPVNRLTRWQLVQSMRDHFWARWAQEYLHSLTQRPKWLKKESRYEVGRLCLIRQENSAPAHWPLARIIRVHPGRDGLIRVVAVRTVAIENGRVVRKDFTRPITKIILLPVSHAEKIDKEDAAQGDTPPTENA
ncbi:uncharacterized protein LOC118644969 [Monomorium pharaonis]|uniref:uncharacterized protein LOC118644969 n=1 Tax=Monomorium pharaonis TaxID=307658 RepID=UPI001747CBA0|nr:uncharacterized protein LOC118644969 [Monomorium pharaonis]